MNFKKAIEIEANYASAYYYMGLVFIRKSLLNTKDTAIGVKYIQYAEKLGLPQAQEFLENNSSPVVANTCKHCPIAVCGNGGICCVSILQVANATAKRPVAFRSSGTCRNS